MYRNNQIDFKQLLRSVEYLILIVFLLKEKIISQWRNVTM